MTLCQFSPCAPLACRSAGCDGSPTDGLAAAVAELRELATRVAGWGSLVLVDSCTDAPTATPIVRALAGDLLRLLTLARCEAALAALHPAPSGVAYSAPSEPVQRVGVPGRAEGPASRYPVLT